jgi:hypothetical protein
MKIATVAVAVALATALPGSATVAQTAQESQACMGDVMRLCASAIPSRDRIIACMLRNRSELGSECRAVMTRYPAKAGPGHPQADKPRIEQAVSLE